MTEQQTQVLKQAIATYGADHQLNIAIEEMSELTKAICKFKRFKGDNEIDQIHEEIADVSIMIEQILMIIGNREQTIIYIDRKIQRLNDNLEASCEICRTEWEYEHGAWCCSECGEDNPYNADYGTSEFARFCPNCGKKMEAPKCLS